MSCRRHGQFGKPTYVVWQNMLARCRNPKHKSFSDYGGRGVTVCERWLTFENFLADMGERPQGLTLDRIESNGNYEPGNCRWATWLMQGRNRRGIRKITVDGVELGMSEWAERLGVSTQVIWYRISAGWDPKQAVMVPLVPNDTPQYRGKHFYELGSR